MLLNSKRLIDRRVSQSISSRAVCFATSRPTNHAIYSFIDLSGYASGSIRRCLFIDYIIIQYLEDDHSHIIMHTRL